MSTVYLQCVQEVQPHQENLRIVRVGPSGPLDTQPVD
jgi:hypothetical protein